MDEQRLQEIEARNGVGEEYLRGIGYTDSADILALVAEVRRLRADVLQQQAEKVEVVTRITEQRDVACDDSDRFREVCVDVGCVINALGKDIASLPSLVLDVVRERDAALAERDAADEALAACRSQGYSAIANLYALCQRMNRQKTAARRDEVMGHATRIASQAGIPTGVMAMLRDAVPTDAPTLVKEQDAAIAERDALRELLNVYNIGGWTDALAPMQRALKAEAALTEARRVLREVEWGKSAEWCCVCLNHEEHGHASTCALAAVLAQEEK